MINTTRIIDRIDKIYYIAQLHKLLFMIDRNNYYVTAKKKINIQPKTYQTKFNIYDIFY